MSLSTLSGSDSQPLLDCEFPDVSGKGRGYILNATPSGTEQWPALRKMSIWQTSAALHRVNHELRSVINNYILYLCYCLILINIIINILICCYLYCCCCCGLCECCHYAMLYDIIICYVCRSS